MHMKSFFVLAGSAMLVLLMGCGWIAVEMRHPIVFRMLDQYEEDVRWQARERSIQAGLRQQDELQKAIEHNKRVFEQTAHLP